MDLRLNDTFSPDDTPRAERSGLTPVAGSMPWGGPSERVAAYRELLQRGLAPTDADIIAGLEAMMDAEE